MHSALGSALWGGPGAGPPQKGGVRREAITGTREQSSPSSHLGPGVPPPQHPGLAAVVAGPDTPTNQGDNKAVPHPLVPAPLDKSNKMAHLFLSLTDFPGNGLLVPLM